MFSRYFLKHFSAIFSLLKSNYMYIKPLEFFQSSLMFFSFFLILFLFSSLCLIFIVYIAALDLFLYLPCLHLTFERMENNYSNCFNILAWYSNICVNSGLVLLFDADYTFLLFTHPVIFDCQTLYIFPFLDEN